MKNTEQEIIAEIEEAFVGVPFPKTTLHEAELVDETLFRDVTDDEIETAIKKDKVSHWNEVLPSHIEECEAAFSHLTPDGFLFYMPAYMCYVLESLGTKGDNSNAYDKTLTHLELSDEPSLRSYCLERFKMFNEKQSIAVLSYLKRIKEISSADDAKTIDAAIDKYWGQFEKNKPNN